MTGPVPFQLPASAVRGWPCVAAPETAGGAVLTGGAAAIAIGAEKLCVDVPAALVAVTPTRTVPPTSAAVGV